MKKEVFSFRKKSIQIIHDFYQEETFPLSTSKKKGGVWSSSKSFENLVRFFPELKLSYKALDIQRNNAYYIIEAQYNTLGLINGLLVL